jgi:phenylpyruvate tautomerase PptA (4-oxalocrotonate tautomerase family)
MLMPLANIALQRGKPAEYRHAISAAVHQALVEVVGIPEADKFHLITEFERENLIYDASFLDIRRTDDIVIIQITLRTGRSRDTRVKLHQRIASLLSRAPGIRPEDVFITLVENDYADWSVGRGEAPLMSLLPPSGNESEQ